MRNITELRAELCEVFSQLKAGAITPKEAQEMNNAAGKITAGLKVELEYHVLTKQTASIPFLEPSDA